MKKINPTLRSLGIVILLISSCWLSVRAIWQSYYPPPQVCTSEQLGNQNLLTISDIEPIAENIHTVGHIGGEAKSVFISKTYAFVKSGLELAAFDISDPIKPNKVGFLMIPGDLIHIDQNLDYAFIHHKGLWRVDISDPTNMSAVHLSYPQGRIESIKIADENAYITTIQCEYISIGFGSQMKTGCKNALHIVNISNPEDSTKCIGGVLGNITKIIKAGGAPELIDNLQKHDKANGYFFNISEEKGLQIFDIGLLSQTSEVNTYASPLEPFYTVFVYDSTAFITTYNNNHPLSYYDLLTIDISEPANPKDIKKLPFHPKQIVTIDNFAFIQNDVSGNFDVIDMQAPFSKEKIILPPDLVDVVQPNKFFNLKKLESLSNNRIVKYRTMKLIDFFTKRQLSNIIALYDPDGRIGQWTVIDNFIFATSGREGLQIIDISNPTSPKQVGRYITGTYISGIDVMCPYIYITDADNGFFILQTDLVFTEGCK